MTSLVGSRGMQSNTGASLRGGATGNKIPKGYRAGQLQQFTPEQMGLFQQLFSQVSPDSFTARLAGGDQSQFGEIEAPALKQFSALQGNLASRFSGMGSGARRSSGFQNTMNQAGSDFAQTLQSQRQGLQRQAIQDLLGMSSELLGQRPSQRFITPKEPSFFDKWLGLAGNVMGSAGQGAAQGMGSAYGMARF